MSDYSSTYPAQSPTFAFDAKAGKLDSRLSYSRSSGGTYLSNEKSLNSENLLLQSQDFDTSPWSNHNLATTGGLTGGATAPDGTSTAWLLTGGVSTGSTSSPSVYMNLFGTASGMVQPNSQNTYVMHVKSGTATHAWVTVRGDSSNYVAAVLDFSNTSALTTYQSGWTLDSYNLTALGNSWYRIALTFTSNSAVSFGQIYVGPTDSNSMTTYYPQWAYNGESIFAWGAQLSSTNSKVYDSPTTTQISREYAPLLKTAAADSPRFEFAADGQSAAGSPLGLLVESQATNLVTHSSAFDDSSWTKVRSQIDSNAAISPDGTLTADYFRADSDSANGAYVTGSVVSITNNATVNASVYHKKTGGDNYAAILVYDSSSNGVRQWWNLSSNTTASTSSFGSGFSIVNAGVEEVGNGWVRLDVSVSCAGTAARFTVYPSVATDGGYANSVQTTNALLWGAQLTESSAPSSLILTDGSQLSRAADSCSVATADIGYTGGSVSVIAEANMPGDNVGSAVELSDGTSQNRASMNCRTDGAQAFTVVNAGGTQAYIGNTTLRDGKRGMRIDNNNFGYCENGGTVITDVAGVVPVTDTLELGRAYNGNELNGYLKRVSLYSVALSDTELQALTS